MPRWIACLMLVLLNMHFYWDNGSGAPGTEIPGADCFEDIATIVWQDVGTIHEGLFR
jgi:hypothetical protein